MTLDAWIDRELGHAAAQMLRSVSATDLVKQRPGFGQTIRASRGSIVASPVLAAYDPDPDYFFHWYRDAAVVIDALGVLFELGSHALIEHFADFVRFNVSLRELDGRKLVTDSSWRARVREDCTRFVRTDPELASVQDDALAADTRVNPDGTIDISRWARPQHDGPALRALAVLRWMGRAALHGELSEAASSLLRFDLAFTRRHWRTPCFDIWEEEEGLHYYTLRVSAAALSEGARWLENTEPGEAEICRHEAAAIYERLDEFWLAPAGYYRSRVLSSGARSAKELDISVVLAAVHAQGDRATHSPSDPRMRATLARLTALFEGEYAINRERPPSRAPALGRYANDAYYSGGAWYLSTLAAAELCYRAAAATRGPGRAEAYALEQQGDAFLETVRAFTPPSGDLSEQFDRNTGAQTSAKHLAWSYAALISAVAARRALTSRPESR
jgi:glucoamylase